MQLAEIVSVSQMPGIYKVIGKKQDGLIVKSLVDGKSQFISGRTNMFSTLDNITIYTTDEPVAFQDVLLEMKKQFSKNPPVAGTAKEAELRAYFEKILPTYDKEKVYLSDIKKMVKWYAILDENNVIAEILAEQSKEVSKEEGGDSAEKAKKSTKKSATDEAPAKETKAKTTKTASKAKVAAPKTNVAPKKITTPRKAS